MPKKKAEGLQKDCTNNKCRDGQVKEKNEWINCPVYGGAGKLNKEEEEIEQERKEKKRND